MKRSLILALTLLCLLFLPSVCSAQFQNHFSLYTAQSLDDSGPVILYQTVTLDGYTVPPPGMPSNIVHTPHVQNKIGSTGGMFIGPGVCPSCHITYSPTISHQEIGYLIEEDDTSAEVVCTIAGVFFSVTNSGTSRFIQAYYQCTNWTGGQCAVNNQIGQRPYARCNPQSDACDEVEMGTSPLSDGSWPQYGLFNAVFISIPNVANICIVGHHGTRADTCISPDPHP